MDEKQARAQLRQERVLELFDVGLSIKEIARTLWLSPNTVTQHLNSARKRRRIMELEARAEAAEAKVEKLVEALREIAKEMHYPMGIGVDPAPTCAAKIARAALAEIEGDRK